jgi:hypothetical protein
MSAREPITALIIDDTGFLKQGTQSPGGWSEGAMS